MNFLDILAAAKTRRGFTSDNQLALALGVTRQSLSQWRSGRNAPDIENCKKLADFSGFSLTEVHALAEEHAAISPSEKRLWRSIAAAIFVSVLVTFPAVAKPVRDHAVCTLCEI